MQACKIKYLKGPLCPKSDFIFISQNLFIFWSLIIVSKTAFIGKVSGPSFASVAF
jgi:hypothetical protein